MHGAAMLRVGNVRSEDEIELIRDALDQLGIDYAHADSEPEDSYPQTVYFYVPGGSAGDVENVMRALSGEHDFDAEVI